MFPYVASEDRLRAVHQRVLAIGGLHDRQLAVLDGNPAPARAELRLACIHEVVAELVITAKVAVECSLHLARQLLAAAAVLHPVPEMQVIVMLRGIVEEARN